MVGTIAITDHSKTKPLEIWTSKWLVLQCVWYSYVRSKSPHSNWWLLNNSPMNKRQGQNEPHFGLSIWLTDLFIHLSDGIQIMDHSTIWLRWRPVEYMTSICYSDPHCAIVHRGLSAFLETVCHKIYFDVRLLYYQCDNVTLCIKGTE